MQNAHLRMGRLEFTTSPGRNSTGTHIKLPMDRVIVEPAGDREGSRGATCFQSSVAIRMSQRSWPPFQRRARFTTERRGRCEDRGYRRRKCSGISEFAHHSRRKHAVRHLVAVSEELSLTQAGASPDAQRTILCDDDTRFILYRLGVRFGLPVLPEWSEWVVTELRRLRALTPLIGLGCQSGPRERHKSIAAESCEYGPEARAADDFGQRLHGAVEFAWPVSGCRIRDSTWRH